MIDVYEDNQQGAGRIDLLYGLAVVLLVAHLPTRDYRMQRLDDHRVTLITCCDFFERPSMT